MYLYIVDSIWLCLTLAYKPSLKFYSKSCAYLIRFVENFDKSVCSKILGIYEQSLAFTMIDVIPTWIPLRQNNSFS